MMRNTSGDFALGSDSPLSVWEWLIWHVPQREVHDYLCGSPGRASGHKTNEPSKKTKVSDKEKKEGDCVGSSCSNSPGPWALVVWSAFFVHGHAGLPTMTRKAQSHKDGPFQSQERVNTYDNKIRQWKHQTILVFQSLYCTQGHESFCLLLCHWILKVRPNLPLSVLTEESKTGIGYPSSGIWNETWEKLCSLRYAERLNAELCTLPSLQKVCRMGGQAEVPGSPPT